MHFPARQHETLKITALKSLSIDDLYAWAPRGINISILIQLEDRTPLESSRVGEIKYVILAG